MEEGSCFQKPIREQGAQGTDFVYHMFLSGDRMCPFTVFNSLALCSLPPLSVQKKRKGCVLFEGVCQRKDPSRKSSWWHLAMRGVRTWERSCWSIAADCVPLICSVELCAPVVQSRKGVQECLALRDPFSVWNPWRSPICRWLSWSSTTLHRQACLGHRAVVCHVCW